MSLNLCKDIQYGQQSNYEIQMETLQVNGELVQYRDEFPVICIPYQDTLVFRARITSSSGGTDKLTWQWQNDGAGNSWALCSITTSAYLDLASYCVIVTPDFPSPIQPWGVVKLNQIQFKVSGRRLDDYHIVPCSLSLFIVGRLA